jgi:hypothetical protein
VDASEAGGPAGLYGERRGPRQRKGFGPYSAARTTNREHGDGFPLLEIVLARAPTPRAGSMRGIGGDGERNAGLRRAIVTTRRHLDRF